MDCPWVCFGPIRNTHVTQRLLPSPLGPSLALFVFQSEAAAERSERTASSRDSPPDFVSEETVDQKIREALCVVTNRLKSKRLYISITISSNLIGR